MTVPDNATAPSRSSAVHEPVLLDEALAGLALRAEGTYVDATFGRGGHTRAVLDRLGPAGRLVAFDRDPAAARVAADIGDTRCRFVRRPFAEIPESLAEAGISNFNLEIRNAFAAPATMPKPIQAKLAALISEIARSEDVRAKLFQQGWQTVGSSPEGLANRIKADTNLVGGVIAMRGIKAE